MTTRAQTAARRRLRQLDERMRAREMIATYLSDGQPHELRSIKAALREAGIGNYAAAQAARDIGVRHEIRVDRHSRVDLWALPPQRDHPTPKEAEGGS